MINYLCDFVLVPKLQRGDSAWEALASRHAKLELRLPGSQAGALVVIHKCTGIVIPAGKRVSSAMDGKLKYIHVAWIPAIPAGMTDFETLVYNDESRSLGASVSLVALPIALFTLSLLLFILNLNAKL